MDYAKPFSSLADPVKEGGKNWEEEISSEHNVVMGGTRQDGEL